MFDFLLEPLSSPHRTLVFHATHFGTHLARICMYPWSPQHLYNGSFITSLPLCDTNCRGREGKTTKTVSRTKCHKEERLYMTFAAFLYNPNPQTLDKGFLDLAENEIYGIILRANSFIYKHFYILTVQHKSTSLEEQHKTTFKNKQCKHSASNAYTCVQKNLRNLQ